MAEMSHGRAMAWLAAGAPQRVAGVHGDILKRRKPDLDFPIRSLGNVSYSTKRGYFEIGKQKKIRTLTVNTVKNFAQTLRMMGLSKELV